MPIVARPYKLKRDDTWGICLKAEDNPRFDVASVNIGTEVEVTTKSGKTWNNTISQVIYVSKDRNFVMCRTEENAPKRNNPQCICEHCGAKLDARTGKRLAGPARHESWNRSADMGVPKIRPEAPPSGHEDELPF